MGRLFIQLPVFFCGFKEHLRETSAPAEVKIRYYSVAEKEGGSTW